jgi:oligopeptide/dipeptide ABC transporter ATP-binding protein
VEGVGFDLAAGESLAVVGESGSGKTLLGRALLGLLPEEARSSGSLRLSGEELSGLPERRWRRVRGARIALVFQEPASAFDPVSTIGAQIVEAILLHRTVSGRQARRMARDRLAEVGFPDPERGLQEYAHRLSGGLQQRAFLALALAADPEVLVADEPTTALDATVAAQVLELLDRLRRERALALLLITHDLAVVAQHCDRVLVLYAGRIVEEAATVELFRAPQHPYTRGLLRSVPRLEHRAGMQHFSTIPGAVPDLASRRSGSCAFAPRCPERFDPCDRRDPALYRAGPSRARCFLYEAPGAAAPATSS